MSGYRPATQPLLPLALFLIALMPFTALGQDQEVNARYIPSPFGQFTGFTTPDQPIRPSATLSATRPDPNLRQVVIETMMIRLPVEDSPAFMASTTAGSMGVVALWSK